mmetsp:Transcript_13883/g.39499  ORF Transcript_13883/g.39499 Transcript_13883/m.39499 type:complete len:277 (-) Transcript_13883:287-1117(-)
MPAKVRVHIIFIQNVLNCGTQILLGPQWEVVQCAAIQWAVSHDDDPRGHISVQIGSREVSLEPGDLVAKRSRTKESARSLWSFIVIGLTANGYEVNHSVIEAVPHIGVRTRLLVGHVEPVPVSGEVLEFIRATCRTRKHASSLMIPRTDHVGLLGCHVLHDSLESIPGAFVRARVCRVVVVRVRDITDMKEPVHVQLAQLQERIFGLRNTHIPIDGNGKGYGVPRLARRPESVGARGHTVAYNAVVVLRVRGEVGQVRHVLVATVVLRRIRRDRQS